MCGIAGFLRLSASAAAGRKQLEGMICAIRHRGPDQAGMYLDERVGLGHCRLSVIDLETGSQPMSDQDETLWITYNGEIYNYPELRLHLGEKGHRFRTRSDTEVIVHLYQEYGSRCLEHLNGQYAFAVWNRRSRTLFLARDPFGIRPLYYARRGDLFLFASEIKALFASGLVSAALNPAAVDQVFTFWTLLPGTTCFEGVEELPPGHFMTVADGAAVRRRYWALRFPPACEAFPGSRDDARGEVSRRLQRAVRLRLRADVRVGCYLSGGVDSTAVTALVGRCLGEPPRSFGIAFNARAFDESSYQLEAARHLETDHHRLQVSAADIASAFADVVRHCEQPLLRTAPVPLYLLAKRVRSRGIKVVVTGEGADEMFLGYNIFKETKIRRFWARNPRSACRPLLLDRLYPYLLNDPKLKNYLRRFFARNLGEVNDPFYSHRLRWSNIARMKRLFSPCLAAAVEGDDPLQRLRDLLPAAFDRWRPLAKAQYLETTLFMSNYLLSCQGDRVAMAHGLEVRMPYLDPELVAFLSTLPCHWKMPGLKEKHLLKDAVEPFTPLRIVKRVKHPYRAPGADCFLGRGSDGSRELLRSRSIKEAGFFDPHKVQRLINKLERAKGASEMDSMAFLGVLSTQILYHRFVKEPAEARGRNLSYRLIDRRRERFETTMR